MKRFIKSALPFVTSIYQSVSKSVRNPGIGDAGG